MKYRFFTKRINIQFLSTCFLFYFCSSVFGQISVSPLGRYGIGDVSPLFQPQTESVGGVVTTYTDSGTINRFQPASLMSLGKGVVVLEAGGTGSISRFSYNQKQLSSTSADFAYLAMAIPIIKNRWTTALSISPFSSAGYIIDDTLTTNSVELKNQRNGSFSSLDFLHGIRINKHFSVGLSLQYLFGRSDLSSAIRFPEDPNLLSSEIIRTHWLNGFRYSGGVLYQHHFHRPHKWQRDSLGRKLMKVFSKQDSLHLIVGLRFSPSQSVNGLEGLLATTYIGNQQNLDTVMMLPSQKGTVLLPFSSGIGFTIKNSDNRWLALFDLSYTDWNQFRYFGKKDSLSSSYRISAGLQHQPVSENMSTSTRNYFQKIKYRSGFYYTNGNLKPYGKALPEFGISIGFGLPFSWKTYNANRGVTHTFNIAITAAQRGLSESKLKEQSIRISFAIAFNDRWFHKRQYE